MINFWCSMTKKKYSLIILFTLFFSTVLKAEHSFSNYRDYPVTETTFKIEKVADSLSYPWGMSFIDKEHLLVTEKGGTLLKINVNTGEKIDIAHNIQSIRFDGGGASDQGGLLDVYTHDDYIYFTYSHDLKASVSQKAKERHSSSAVARGRLENNKVIDLEVLLIAAPSQKGKKHYGSRIAIKDNILYAGFGERDLGMIAQDPRKHPGSIVRINLDGTIPGDNPAFTTHLNWLPELYQIGVRNSQGITVSPHDSEVYFSNHGPRGGDFIGLAQHGGNYGWKHIAWGGTKYNGFRIGDVPFSKEFDIPLITWVPSPGVGSIHFYSGKVFPEWEGDLLVSALKGKCLIRLDFLGGRIVSEEIIFKNKIGRIRDFEVDDAGNIFLISDDADSGLWKLSK
jgi:glucose/arabinose dehydrogenase